MKVKLFSVENDNTETLEIECDFSEIEWPDADDPEIAIAADQLATVGHYFVGGGAAAAFVLRRA